MSGDVETSFETERGEKAGKVARLDVMPLPAFHLLAGIIAARAGSFSRFGALNINHRSCGHRLSTNAHAVELHQVVVQRLEKTVISKLREPSTHTLIRRQTVREKPPRAPCPQNTVDRVHNRAHRPASTSSTFPGGRQTRLNQLPLLIGEILAQRGYAAYGRSDSPWPVPELVSQPSGIMRRSDRPPLSFHNRSETVF